MKKIVGIGFAVILSVLFVTSCQQWFMDKRARLLVKNDKGLLRGVELDMALAQVKGMEKDSIYEESPTFLGYFIPCKEKNERLEVEYSFNEQGRLDLITGHYYLEKDDDAEHMIAELKKFFDKKLGASKQDEKGWQVWQYKDTKGKPGEVEVVLNKSVNEKNKVVDLEIVKYYDSETNSSRTLKKN